MTLDDMAELSNKR